MTTLSAEITKVKIGILEIDGLMDEQGEYYVAVPQVADLFQIESSHASRDIKTVLNVGKSVRQDERSKTPESLCGKDSVFAKLKTPLNSKAVNAISLPMFELLVAKLDRKGNKLAQDFRDALVGLSLIQLFSDAFGIKFEAEDRQKWLNCRFNTKHDFRPLTDQLKAYGFSEPWEYGKFIHLMQSKIGLEDGTRDYAEYEILNKLERAQTRLTTMMECGISPYNALAKL